MSEFKRCDERRYNDRLEVLLPMEWTSKGFLVSEPWSHRECTVSKSYRATYMAMVRRPSVFGGYEYFESMSGLTVPEWRELVPSKIIVPICGAWRPL